MSAPKKKTRCPSCGRSLSQRALKQHRGRKPCVQQYTQNKLKEQFSMPAGHARVSWRADDFAYTVMRLAGLPPEQSPVQWVPIAPNGELIMVLVAPTWLATMISVVSKLDDAVEASERALKRIADSYDGNAAHAPGYIRRQAGTPASRLAVQAQRDAGVHDLVVLLTHDNDEDPGRLGFATEISLLSSDDDSDYVDQQLLEALRREASRSLGGM